jgi:hypothetical protein
LQVAGRAPGRAGWGSLSSACAFGVETIAVMADGLGPSCAIKGSNPEPAERHD